MSEPRDTRQKETHTWTGKSVAPPLGHRIFYWLLKVGGYTPAYCLLIFVALWYTLKPSLRERARPYLSRRFPNMEGLAALWHTYKFFFVFGQVIVDRAATGILGTLDAKGSEADKALMRDLLDRGKGLIVLTAHVGPWQTAMMGLDFSGAEVSVALRKEEGDVDRHFYEHGEGKAPFSIIDPAGPMGGVLEMLAALKKGHVLCIMGDRTFPGDKNTVRVRFLGGTIQLPVKAYSVASASGAPIVVVLSHRTGPGKSLMRVCGVIEVPPRLGRDNKAAEPYAEAFAKTLQEYVQAHPCQFFNFYDLWA